MSTFVNKQTGEKVRIVKEDAAFYTLDDGVKIKKETFTKRYTQTEEIDPNDFFSPRSAIEKLAQDLKSIDPSKVQEDGSGARIKMKPPTVLQDNSREQINPVNNTSEGIKISEAQKQRMIEEWRLKQELGEQTQPPSFMNESTQPTQDTGYIEYEMPGQGGGSMRQINQPTQPTSQVNTPTQPQMDPMQMMFKMFKNNYEVKIQLEFDEKIADPQFIQMIMENVEGDAVEYYTKIMMDKIIKNPLKLKKEIYRQLKIEIFGEEVVLEEERLEAERLEAEEKAKKEAEEKAKLEAEEKAKKEAEEKQSENSEENKPNENE